MKPESHAMAANRPQTGTAEYKEPDEPADESMSKSETPTDDESGTESIESAESGLHAAPTGPNTYTVLSGENAYSVDIAGLTCTCPDYVYDVDVHETCKHLRKALRIHPHPDGYYSFKGGRVERVDVTQSGAPSREEAEDIEETESSITDSGPSAKVQADNLQAAYDDVIEDMQVQANEGLVWVQTGRDTPDDWPFPGADSTFDALLKNAELMTFVGDPSEDYPDHEWLSKRPGEWWKDAIEPGDVDAYISEVLD